jgi:hypothetical protein
MKNNGAEVVVEVSLMGLAFSSVAQVGLNKRSGKSSYDPGSVIN